MENQTTVILGKLLVLLLLLFLYDNFPYEPSKRWQNPIHIYVGGWMLNVVDKIQIGNVRKVTSKL